MSDHDAKQLTDAQTTVTREDLYKALLDAPDGSWWDVADAILAAFTVLHPAPVAVPPPEHGADWSDWQPGDDGDSCLCGFNGTSQECEQSRAVYPTERVTSDG